MHLEEVRIISLFYILFSNEMITGRDKEKNNKMKTGRSFRTFISHSDLI